jgi:hypothetical protein
MQASESRGDQRAVKPPTCAGVRKRHRDKAMVLVAHGDDGARIWRCPRCLFVWRERP